MRIIKEELWQKKWKWLERSLVLGFFLAALFLCGLIEYSNGDDAYFYNMAHSKGFFEYIKMRYIEWEGRITSEAMTYIAFYFGKTFWQFANACILTALPAGLLCIVKKMKPNFNDRESFFLAAAVYVGIFFLDMSVIGYGAFWVTGSVFYLWSIVAGIWAAMPFVNLVYGKETDKKETSGFWYGIPLGIIAAMGQEQIAAVVIVFGALSVIYHYVREKKIHWLALLEVVIMIVSLLILFLSPGTEARSQSEIVTWLPQFATMSVGAHIFMVLQWLLSAFGNQSKMLFIVIWLLCIAGLAEKRTHGSRVLAVVAGIEIVAASLSYIGIPWFSEMGLGDLDITQCVTEVATPATLTGQNWLAFIWWSLAFVFTLVLLWQLWESLREKLVAQLLLLASFASGAIMYFSPTIYASGGRVLFMTQILMWLLIGVLFGRLEEKRQRIFLLLLCVGGLVNFSSGVSYMLGFINKT